MAGSLLVALVAMPVSALALVNADDLETWGDAMWCHHADDGYWHSGKLEGESGDSVITQTVTGPGVWSCEWAVSCETNHAFLALWIDNTLVDFVTGEMYWEPVRYLLDEGEHTIMMAYQKWSHSSSEYADCGWMRNWDWESVRPLTVGHYVKMTLPDLGYDVPTNGVTQYSVVAKGLPAGLALKHNAAVKDKKGRVTKKEKVEWWIEGVPTAALDYATNPAYLVITVKGKAEMLPLPVTVLAQEVKKLDDLDVGQSVNEQFFLPGVTNGWTVTGLPAGLNYTATLVTTKKKVGKKTVVATNALPYSVYGKTTKAGLFTVTAKKKAGGYYETMKYRVLVTPAAPDAARFGEDLTNITTMAYVPVAWDLTGENRLGESALPGVSAIGGKVAKVMGLPAGVAFAAANVYRDKKKTQVKQYGQTVVGTPTKPGTYVVTFTKNVKSGTKTVAKKAQVLWTVVPSDVELSLAFNEMGGVVLNGTVGLYYGVNGAFYATSGAKVTVSGLPSGLNFVDQGNGIWALAGSAIKGGMHLVTVTATLNGKTVRQRLAMRMEELQPWAKGTFNGVTSSADCSIRGLATISVASDGKISGKFQELGTNWTISASCYEQYFPQDEMYRTPVTAKFAYKVKVGKFVTTRYLTRFFNLDLFSFEDMGLRSYLRLSEDAAPMGTRVDTYQNRWGTSYKTIGNRLFYTSKKVPYKTFTVKGASEKGAGMGMSPEMNLSLKVTPKGAVTATLSFDTGKTKKDPKTKKTVKVIYKPTCSSVVIPNTPAEAEAFSGNAYLYFAPSPANGFPGLATCATLPN